MDPFSHAVLGAALGHGCFHKRLGLTAAVWGAAAAVLPDVDIFFSIGGDEFDALVRHRGITHALIFAPVLGPIWGYLLARYYARGGAPPSQALLWTWIGAITLALWSHPLLDYVTPYGTQLLQPFSDTRFATAAMPIIDPAYTLILALGVVLAWRWSPAPRAHYASLAAVILSTAYIGYAGHLNDVARAAATEQLEAAGITGADVSAYPTLLQLHYRRIVARTPTEDRVGFFDTDAPCPIAWGVAPRAEAAVFEHLVGTREGRIFEWFTMGMTHASVATHGDVDHVEVADLRYGETTDPDKSIFSMVALFEPTGRLQVAQLQTYRPNMERLNVADLIGAAYAACLR
jgi:inner membrane protein